MHGTHASSAPTAPNVPPARSPSTVGPLGPEIYRLPPPRSWAQPSDYHLLPVSHSHPLKEPAQKSLGTSGSQPSPMPSISAPFRLASPQARFPRPLTSTRLSQPPWPPVDYRPLSSPISTNPGPTPPPASCFCLPAAESRWGDDCRGSSPNTAGALRTLHPGAAGWHLAAAGSQSRLPQSSCSKPFHRLQPPAALPPRSQMTSPPT